MCQTPIIINGYELSCRECNECCATYKNTWVARCLAEMETNPFALSFTLTYADVNGEAPLGARVYRYKDVQDMWKRIRYHGLKKWPDFRLRYVIVGERGTRFDRCHYHGVLFSNYPVKELGIITNSKGVETFGFKKRLNWSLWGNGFVEFQEATRKGISYTLKYILKARMTDARSKGTNREGKTEYLASSYLWCSKVPAIGAGYLRSKLEELVSLAMCPSSFRVQVPGGGDWYVHGVLQKEMALFLREANMKFNSEHGRDLAGWAQLKKSVEEDIELTHGQIVKRKAWEFLEYGDIEHDTGGGTPEAAALARVGEAANDASNFASEIAARRKASKHSTQARRCFGVRACQTCEGFRSIGELADDASVEALWRQSYRNYRKENAFEGNTLPFHEWITRQGIVAEGCLQKGASGWDIYERSAEHQKANEELNSLQRTTNPSGS